MVNAENSVESSLYRLYRKDCIDNRSKRAGHCSHEISAGKHPVAEFRLTGAEFDSRLLDYVGNFNSGRTCDVASLAIKAIFEGLVEEISVLQPEPLPVRTGLLRARIIRIYRNDRAVYCTDCALDTLLEIIFTYTA